MSDIFDHEGDAWDSLIYNEEPNNWYPKPKKCKYCGKPGLYWKETKSGWRLFDRGNMHVCLSHVTLPN